MTFTSSVPIFPNVVTFIDAIQPVFWKILETEIISEKIVIDSRVLSRKMYSQGRLSATFIVLSEDAKAYNHAEY